MPIDKTPRVTSVSRNGEHRFSKLVVDEITLIAGYGVDGDAHAGATVQHLSRMEKDAAAPNLRQVHLIQSEVFTELGSAGYAVTAGALGENLTTVGVDLFTLPQRARLHLGDEAVIEVTGLRNPCRQINGLAPGLMKALFGTDDDGNVVRKTGVMSVVISGGTVRAGDGIRIELPVGEQLPLETV